MIRIAEISVVGESERGPFSGSIQLQPGMNVISGANRFGKSLAFASVVWGMGVEHIYGVNAGSNSIFPEAARRTLEVDGDRDVAVRSSDSVVVFRRDDEAVLRVTRNIVGGDQRRVRVRDGEADGVLQLGYGSVKDATGGFQRRLRTWADLPEAKLVRSSGGESPIYLENLAPLFLIEQLRGWTDIQAEQVYRYGLQDVANGAFEYLLGLDNWLRNRLQHQQAVAHRSGLKDEANSIGQDFARALEREGWTGGLPTQGALASLAEKWSEFDPATYVRDRFNFDLRAEQVRVQTRMKGLKEKLAKPPGEPGDRAANDASQRVVELKEARHRLQERLRSTRSQIQEQAKVAETVGARWQSAKDLLRLKTEGVGILAVTECPTCHQVVSPETLRLQDQPAEVVQRQVESLDRQRQVLGQNVERLRAQLLALTHEDRKLAQQVETARRSLELVGSTSSPGVEGAVEIAREVMELEREFAKNRRLGDHLEAVAGRMRDWVRRVQELAALETRRKGKPNVLKAFETHLRDNLRQLSVGGITAAEAEQVSLGEHYEPLLGGHDLPAYGSASDRARLVLAYVLALQACGTHHPGFVVLDEPVQQNPDPAHRAKWIEFICNAASDLRGQVVLFTSLVPDELDRLRKADVAVQALEGRFLSLTPDGQA